jgi:glycosyltransferase involved in cell wall biosynthesis
MIVRVLQVMEATLGGTRRYLEDVVQALGPGNQYGLVYSLHRADNAFLSLLETLRSAGWALFELDMRREIEPLRDLRCAFALQRIYREFKPDVVHAHSSKAGGLTRVATLGMKHRPGIVYTPNSIATNVSWIYGLLERVLALRADIIVAVTESERDELLRLKLLPHYRLHIAVPTIPSDRFAPSDRALARQALGLGEGPMIIGIGRLTAQKDPLSFIELTASLRARVPDLQAIWVGDGELRGAVEQRIAERGLQSCVSITGWLEDVRPYIAATNVFISTSRYESFGYVTAEALAMERAAVATRITGTVDVVTTDTDAQLFALDDLSRAADLAARFLTDPPFADGVAIRGRTYVNAAFSVAETRRGLETAYRAALQSPAFERHPEAPRVAIVSDPLVQRGGAERVVEAMAKIFPQATIHAVLYSAKLGPASLRNRVRSSYLRRIPGAERRHRFLLPFFPGAIESIDLRPYDVIVSSHHTVAKGLVRGADALHVCYCHTPMRALWERTHEELATLPAFLRPIGATIFRNLRVWDVATVPRVDVFVANSETTRQRIRKHYARESIVVYPPIEIDRFTPSSDVVPSDYYLVASRLVPYKRVELALEAAQLAKRRLIIVGEGPGRAALLARGADIRGHVTDAELVSLMRGARALIFPQFEDFGMTPVEMMACGRPVIAYGRGGAAETVIDGVTGILVNEQTPDAFARAIERLESLTISPAACRARAEEFSAERFARELSDAVWGAYRVSSAKER